MKIFVDFKGRKVRLTEERIGHFYKRLRNAGLFEYMEETIRDPDFVIESVSDPDAAILYHFYRGSRTGNKFLCVVVKYASADAYVMTAYPSDQIKKGRVLWERKKK
ncbi:MAG TPA: PBECR2 nuclease fold domain-containing protein [Candidatus Kapabacteria bacterium]|nr:PBECR2 nuclease fold domain-containing protein [Candidatus Kapabacteria bacterium]